MSEAFAQHEYQVPLYQRAYAWTDSEIHTLLADVRDARRMSLHHGPETRDYYIGSLVVDASRADANGVLEVVDGQQRLTTLYIILSVAPKIFGDRAAFDGSLTFEGRDTAAQDLRIVARHGADQLDRLKTSGIEHAAGLVAKACQASDEAEHDLDSPQDLAFSREDLEYLRNHVKILCTVLPPDTDLNHYFEVMNTRGEQLEKHEILKAQLSSALADDRERTVFAQIWDACAVLDRHLQTRFSTSTSADTGDASERERIFGKEWNRFLPRNENELFQSLTPAVSGPAAHSPAPPPEENPRLLLTEVLQKSTDPKQVPGGQEDEESGSYGAIIDFPNLLLHVLRIQREEPFRWGDPGRSGMEVRLEDKYLIAEFERTMPRRSAETRDARRAWVRKFCFLLLKTRFLMDNYVIRTQTTTAGDDEENWVLQRAFLYVQPGTRKRQLSARSTFASTRGESVDADADEEPLDNQVRLLQSMFQVTDTRRASKYFLFQILHWLHQQSDPAVVSGSQFVDQLEAMAHERLKTMGPDDADRGTQVHNFLFNVLDYELWKAAAPGGSLDHLQEATAKELRRVAAGFRFRYRTSVEHFYPSNPSIEQDHHPLPVAHANSFGNLCIMTRSENSRRNNLMPLSKANQFKSTDQSLKFQLMAELALREGDWREPQIARHREAMISVLNDVVPGLFDSGPSPESATTASGPVEDAQ